MLPAEQTALVKQYCADCHSERGKAGGTVARRLRCRQDRGQRRAHGEDDPQAARRHDAAAGRAAARAGGAHRDGRVVRSADGSRRRPSTRIRARVRSSVSIAPSTSNAVRDLLNVDVDVTAYLPPDTISHGFDNVADVAELLADADGRLPARGQPDQPPGGRRSQRQRRRRPPTRFRRSASQMRHVEGAPMGTRGGIVGHAHVPGRRPLRLQDVAALRAARRPGRPQFDDRR